ncbi:MAG: hypothetical protein BGO55_29915 [Sphingobacteriales bacterium 50-39]|nr:MAG: hypothetical protein BGO55_29915 [Sphingobacteriales bacterium 50-39]
MPNMEDNIKDDGILIMKYVWEETLSEKEKLQFQELRSRSVYHDALPEQFANPAWVHEQLQLTEELPMEKLKQQLMNRISRARMDNNPAPIVPTRKRRYLAIAAGITGVVILGGLYIKHHSSKDPNLTPQLVRQQAPARQRGADNATAYLTLPDSSTIVLDSARSGRIDINDALTVEKRSNDTLLYTGTSQYPNACHEITTGGRLPLHIQLPDGTWTSLAPASRLQYSVTPHGAPRIIDLKGQASFEVHRDPGRPFIVNANGTRIEALGTGFNVTAYSDDSITEITLSNGAVKVASASESFILDTQHFRQARIEKGHIRSFYLTDVDVRNIMAWQDQRPHFQFVNTDLKDALRMISRRYLVRVVYKVHVQKTLVNGDFPLSNTLDKTLGLINDTKDDIHLYNQGDSVIIVSDKTDR